MSTPLDILKDYVERSTHWQEGGADRHAALLALKELGEESDLLDWAEKGLAEWRDMWKGAARRNTIAQAQLRIAVGHLQAVLNKARTHAEQQTADTAARDWLTSIGSEPE